MKNVSESILTGLAYRSDSKHKKSSLIKFYVFTLSAKRPIHQCMFGSPEHHSNNVNKKLHQPMQMLLDYCF